MLYDSEPLTWSEELRLTLGNWFPGPSERAMDQLCKQLSIQVRRRLKTSISGLDSKRLKEMSCVHLKVWYQKGAYTVTLYIGNSIVYQSKTAREHYYNAREQAFLHLFLSMCNIRVSDYIAMQMNKLGAV